MLARAAGSPLVRGGLTIGAGIVTGNLTGFFRVALNAYLLGTDSLADSLAVAIGPIDTLNAVLINTMVFAFVPMLTERQGEARTALFVRLRRLFFLVFLALSAAIAVFAPWLIRVLAPGLASDYLVKAEWNLRLGALSTLAAGTAAVHSALLYTERRFAPSAFYQASLNVATVLSALALWSRLGVYSFAVGYAAGAWVQFGVVWAASRSGRTFRNLPACTAPIRDLLAKPAFVLTYAGLIALNITVSRAYATSAGPGMAAALEYTLRCIGVPLAFLVMPISNSLLPEIARLRSRSQWKQAFRLIDRTLALGALAAVAICALAVAVREPVIALLFERGSFTADSTRLVSLVFLGFAPSLIGWSLLEIASRTLFALDRPWLPVSAAMLPVVFNLALSLGLHFTRPQYLGLGPSLGLIAAFFFLFLRMRAARGRWPAVTPAAIPDRANPAG
ncbi:MAG: hypothetical protein IT158_18920 [Bryobacterales bacterium]|nr:hypothetical protein [Bryobacterales bacterium]